MQVQRFSFKEFGEEVTGKPKTTKSFTPAGKKADLPPAPPPPPTFSEEELKAAEREGYKKGFLEGVKEGRGQAQSEQALVEKQLSETVQKFAETIAPLFEDYRKMALAIREEMPKAALAIARKVAGPALAENAQAVINDTVLRTCEAMMKEPKLTVAVHDSLGEALGQKVQELASRLQSAADIVILRDPEMPLADCRVEWHNGMMERNMEKVWQKVEQVVDNAGAVAVRDTKEHLEMLKAYLLAAQEKPKEKE